MLRSVQQPQRHSLTMHSFVVFLAGGTLAPPGETSTYFISIVYLNENDALLKMTLRLKIENNILTNILVIALVVLQKCFLLFTFTANNTKTSNLIVIIIRRN